MLENKSKNEYVGQKMKHHTILQEYLNIPISLMHDENLFPAAKLLYVELVYFCGKEGYCTKSNSFFAARFNVTRAAVSKWVINLKDNGYIKTKIECQYVEDIGQKQTIRTITLLK